MLYLLPLIGALIGWITNYIAVKMLFHPRNPIQLPGFVLQGVFPKRQKVFAHRLGSVVSNELFSVEDVKRLLHASAQSDQFKNVIDQHIETVLTQKLPEKIPMLSMVMSPQLIGVAKEAFNSELNELLNAVVDALGGHLDEALDVHAIIEEKVANFSSDKLEEILFAIMKKEFRFIEFVGGVLGFLIGCVQVLLVSL